MIKITCDYTAREPQCPRYTPFGPYSDNCLFRKEGFCKNSKVWTETIRTEVDSWSAIRRENKHMAELHKEIMDSIKAIFAKGVTYE